jgi:hypothetical protein
MRMILLTVTALFAALAPLMPNNVVTTASATPWPTHFDARPLTRLPAAASDRAFTAGFPGHIAHFSDGTRHILLRQVSEVTRSLHPSRDCYRAMGYAITPLPIAKAPDGQSRACFAASKDNQHFRICEEVRDAKGASYSEISAWYWPALLGSSKGPWMAATIVEQKITETSSISEL